MRNELPRLNSGVEGLDVILGGGFVQGSSYIVQGEPGAGKTVLASQIAFSQARQGGRVLYATLLAESHERLFQSLSTLDFYDAAQLGSGVTFVSVFQTLRTDGLEAVVALLRREIARQSATLLIVDGVLNAHDLADSALDVKTFIAELQGHAAFAGCTVLFLTSVQRKGVSAEHTMVDGVLELREEIVGGRSARHIRVRKSRGSASLGGFHQVEVSGRGVTVYPRLESVYGRAHKERPPEPQRVSTGVQRLDQILGGGLPESSITLVAGPSGSGKTTFGLNFLSASSASEPGLYFGFHETPARVLLKGEALDLGFSALLNSGVVDIIWQPMSENLLDALGHKLLEAVRRRGVKRLVLDGLGGFERAAESLSRLVEFVAALMIELRAEGVTVVATWELSGPALPSRLLAPEFMSTLDNLITLDQLGRASELGRSVAVMKMRDSAFEADLRSLEIGLGGLIVGEKLSDAQTRPADLAASARSTR